jgi:predicted dehydrogenase
MKEKLSRRDMLLAATTIAAGSLGSGQMPSSGGLKNSSRFPEIIRVAIIGLEGHYSEILEAAQVLPQIQVTAIAEKNKALLARSSRDARLKKARNYDSFRRMLDVETLDIIAVCGENGTRAEIVQACAERKLAIVAEKPLALSLEELEATRKKIAAYGVPLTMLLPMRFDPQYQKMRSIIQSGKIGEVVCMGAQKSYKLGERADWMKARKTYGGTIPYIGIHMVDLMRYLSGREFAATAAFHSRVGFPEYGEMENNTALVFQLDNKGTASLRMDYLRPESAPTHGDDRLCIAGTKGIVEFQEGQLTLVTASEKSRTITDLLPGRRLFVDFLDAIYNGKKHVITTEEIFRVTEIVLKAREAADTGRVVPL